MKRREETRSEREKEKGRRERAPESEQAVERAAQEVAGAELQVGHRVPDVELLAPRERVGRVDAHRAVVRTCAPRCDAYCTCCTALYLVY